MVVPETDQILFEEVDEHVQQHMHHPFLQKNQVRQAVSRFHFDVGRAIMQFAQTPVEEIKSVLSAMLLLHHGLSIHDDIDDQSEQKRQLYVLAGDYNSSQYYYLLARVGNNKLLSALCDAVVKINEAKMSLFQLNQAVSSERYMELQETINGELLFTLAKQYLLHPEQWLPQVKSLVKAFVVSEEISTRKIPRYFTFRQAYGWLSEAIERVLHLPANVVMEPITAFVVDKLVPLKNALESQTLAEGNR